MTGQHCGNSPAPSDQGADRTVARFPTLARGRLKSRSGSGGASPPGPAQDTYRVGVTGAGDIVAVSATGAVIDPDFDPTFKLLVLAVATSARGQGGQVADECMIDALTQLQHLASQAAATQFLVIGCIDPRNGASRRMCRRHGFTPIDQDGQYEMWGRLISIM